MLSALKKLFSSKAVDYSTAQRNDPCPCGSGRKYKVCHQHEVDSKAREQAYSKMFRNPKG